ncbi:MAG TPA: hypothetical protein VIH11_00975 [Gemmatimonadaceae bacterium]|uniref:YMGG-like Gly-zipper domain-containing protein n=1 Tax=uncultured Gemmatimonadetes bacterium Rifle_16ft_4_minimus_37772 TaxID=1665097 RepID=A0A0H4TPT0_9BACT|nr:hypothetical protein [uncultured Gemmatimonadetes bacterium Rifle_16ft_4_minimus_37772]HLA90086.1 hypothetical protein [Gemmatimonadaceae bacterium]
MRANDTVRHSAVLAFLALVVAACGGKDAQQANNAPAREIQLAPAPAAQPQLKDVPVATASAPARAPAKAPAKAPEKRPEPAGLHVERAPAPVSVPQPAASASAPAPAGPVFTPMGTVDAGTVFVVRPSARICTSTHKAGDRFSTALNETVQGSNGATIPAGSPVVMRVVESTRSENSKDSVRLVLDVVSVRVGDESYQVDARVTQTPQLERVRAQSTGDQAKKVGTGAVIGAIAGQVLGKNTRSTVTGAVVGAAAGAVVAAGSADYDGCLPANAAITVTLERALKVKVKS